MMSMSVIWTVVLFWPLTCVAGSLVDAEQAEQSARARYHLELRKMAGTETAADRTSLYNKIVLPVRIENDRTQSQMYSNIKSGIVEVSKKRLGNTGTQVFNHQDEPGSEKPEVLTQKPKTPIAKPDWLSSDRVSGTQAKGGSAAGSLPSTQTSGGSIRRSSGSSKSGTPDQGLQLDGKTLPDSLDFSNAPKK